METLLNFFADLILFTAGLVVAAVWLVIIVGICIEIYDLLTGRDSRVLGQNEEEL